ncbi:MAG: hypothetical protein ABH812_04025 [bacterium]
MKFYKVGFFILLLILVAAGAFYFGTYTKNRQEAPKKEDVFTKKEVKKNTSTEEAFMMDEIIEDNSMMMDDDELNNVKENIKAAINTGNFQPFEGYMADEVNVILEASSCCGIKNNSEAALQMKYLYNAEGPWNFDQSNETIKKLKEVEPEKYGPESAFIGIASNEYTVSFKFNKDNKISGITMAGTYKLILP